MEQYCSTVLIQVLPLFQMLKNTKYFKVLTFKYTILILIVNQQNKSIQILRSNQFLQQVFFKKDQLQILPKLNSQNKIMLMPDLVYSSMNYPSYYQSCYQKITALDNQVSNLKAKNQYLQLKATQLQKENQKLTTEAQYLHKNKEILEENIGKLESKIQQYQQKKSIQGYKINKETVQQVGQLSVQKQKLIRKIGFEENDKITELKRTIFQQIYQIAKQDDQLRLVKSNYKKLLWKIDQNNENPEKSSSPKQLKNLQSEYDILQSKNKQSENQLITIESENEQAPTQNICPNTPNELEVLNQ